MNWGYLDEQAVFDTIGTFALANSLIACVSVAGIAAVAMLAVRQKTRNPGLLFGGLGFAFLACANCGFASQIIASLVVGLQADSPEVFLDWLNRMNCAFSVTTVMAVVSLILAFLYTYRKFLPSWREIIIDEGDGPF